MNVTDAPRLPSKRGVSSVRPDRQDSGAYKAAAV